MESTLESKLDRLVETFAEESRVRALWLFGSEARGDSGPTSDVDLAVWTADEVDLEDRIELQTAANRSLGRRDVDLVLVGEANPVLGYRVVTDGRRLYARDGEAADRYEQRLVMRYLDTAHLRRRVQELQREAVE